MKHILHRGEPYQPLNSKAGKTIALKKDISRSRLKKIGCAFKKSGQAKTLWD